MFSKPEDIGYIYIAEQTSPEDAVRNIDIHDKGLVPYVEFDATLHSFDVINRNERRYLRENVEDRITHSEKIQTLLAHNAWYGEKDHPMQETENAKLTPQRIRSVHTDRIAHRIMNPKFEGNLLNAHIMTASGYECGKQLRDEIILGLIPSFSCRALAILKIIDGKPTVMVNQVITYDWVLYPSHKEATMTSDPSFGVKGLQGVTESVEDKVERFSKDVFIPLYDILSRVSKTDVNTQMVMESFELDEMNLMGFTPDKRYSIITDEENTIYTKLAPKTVKEVHDFYSSFNI